MGDVIDLTPRLTAAAANLDGYNMNPTPEDFVSQEIAFLRSVLLDVQETAWPPCEPTTLLAMMQAHASNLRKEMGERGFTLDAPKSAPTLAAEITGLYRHAIRQIVYLAALAHAEQPPSGAA